MPQLFRGTSAYETVCNTCGNPSQGSHRPLGFYELDAQVRGMGTLESSLVRCHSAVCASSIL